MAGRPTVRAAAGALLPRHHDKQKVMTLGADEFIRGFQKHLLETIVLLCGLDLVIGFDSTVHRTITSGPFAVSLLASTERNGSGSLREYPGGRLFGLDHIRQSPVVREDPVLARQHVPSPNWGGWEQFRTGLLPLG